MTLRFLTMCWMQDILSVCQLKPDVTLLARFKSCHGAVQSQVLQAIIINAFAELIIATYLELVPRYEKTSILSRWSLVRLLSIFGAGKGLSPH